MWKRPAVSLMNTTTKLNLSSKTLPSFQKRTLKSTYMEPSLPCWQAALPASLFSTYSRTTNTAGPKDNRWGLLNSFGRLITKVLPDFVTMENVPGLIGQPVFDSFLQQLANSGYQYDYQVVFCPDYGMAQTGKRLVLVASKETEINLPKPSHAPDQYLTVADVITSLPVLTAGQSHKSDPLHRASILSPINLKRIQASKLGGSWLD